MDDNFSESISIGENNNTFWNGGGGFRPFGFEPLRIWGHCQGKENIKLSFD